MASPATRLAFTEHPVITVWRSRYDGDAEGGAAGPISASLSGYQLNVTADDVDALQFEALRERAAHAPDAAAAGLLDAALALWRGPAYAEFADRDFASAEAARRRHG